MWHEDNLMVGGVAPARRWLVADESGCHSLYAAERKTPGYSGFLHANSLIQSQQRNINHFLQTCRGGNR